jgi:hypothetical protein
VVGNAISAKVHPGGFPAALSGGFALTAYA